MSELIQRIMPGLQVTLFGLLGVFGVLVLFYIVVVLLGKIPESKND
jgi:hypothetical protein